MEWKPQTQQGVGGMLGTRLIYSVPQPEEVGGTGEEPWDFHPHLGIKNPKDVSVEKLVPNLMLGGHTVCAWMF